MARDLVVAAYGMGTNSTALIIEMVRRGERIDAILCADTGGERPRTYAYREMFSEWLVAHGYPPITVVKKGGRQETLEEDCLRRGALPSLSYGRKTCSLRFKQEPQTRWLNNWAAAKACWAAGGKVIKLIGYDMDEPHRGQPYQDEKFINRYPLLEWGWGRQECIEAIAAAGLPQPGKSSCFFCPSMTKPEILQLRQEEPALLIRALNIEATASRSGNMESVNGLGRRLNWGEYIELVDEAEANDPSAFFLRQQDFPNPPQCSGCYDGCSLEDDEMEPAA